MNMIDNRTINEWKIAYYVRILTFHLQHQYWILPLITGLLLIGSLSICYYIVVFVNGAWPVKLISDMGALQPVAGYYAQTLDILAIMFLLIAWIRYRQINYYIVFMIPNSTNKQVNNNFMLDMMQRKNFQSFICVIIGAIGFEIVGNFRLNEHLIMHGIGMLLLLFNIPYKYQQKFMMEKFYECDRIESRPLFWSILTHVELMSWIICIASTAIACWNTGHIDQWLHHETRMNWQPDVAGFNWFVIAVLVEWNVCFMFTGMLFSLSHRMYRFKQWNHVF
ncbi:DNA damage-regulated autophagy modulator protein 2 [Dermatophagoides farinae]|uniref:DNA damage-regulated autophagy modulator protein 2 n=1 Tax=Dermatophagoides farinae TaxID=6954 RepID=UPI003F63C406